MTYKGGWFDIPSENQRVKETGIMIFSFEGSKVKEMWCENSDAGILYDLGVLKKKLMKFFRRMRYGRNNILAIDIGIRLPVFLGIDK